LPPAPLATLFPYTTLFRSLRHVIARVATDSHTTRLAWVFEQAVTSLDHDQPPSVCLDDADNITHLHVIRLSGSISHRGAEHTTQDRKSTRLNSSHVSISYA